LTRADFEDRRRYLNVRRTVAALHHLAVIPVVNENDSVAVEEIRFGDNDIIAALISNLLGADLLILLTVVEGLMADGAVLETIQGADERVRRLAGSATSPLGTGGMASKLRAAKLVTDAGQAALIANGRTRNVLLRLLAGEKIGTLLAPTGKRMASRKRWIGLAVRPAGRIVVDHGAAEALRKGGKSLLPIGITAATGDFDRGDVVQITDAAGHPIAQGLVNYDAGELERIKGLRTDQLRAVLGRKCPEEVIHRNNLTLTDRGP
ncbi:MAG: glutamate 5-kinase, partial [Phycisphaerae bacterium]